MVTQKKKANKAVKPTTSKNPQFEKLINQALSSVGPENTHPDSTIYTEDFLREWLALERAKRPTNFDYNPDYTHLRNLAIWDHAEMAGVLFGVTWDGFTHMSEIIRICGKLKPVVSDEKVHFTQRTNRVGRLEWYPKYELMPEIKDWYITANQARDKFDDILSRGCMEIPGLGWKEAEKTRYFTIKDFMPWLVNHFGILKWMEDEGCQIPDGLDKFLKMITRKASKTTANGSKRGQPKFPHEEAVARAVEKLCSKKQKPPKGKMYCHPDIIAAFAPGKEMHIDEDTTKKEYKELTKWKPSTIQKLVRKYHA
jgi:hypothetical protein